MRISMCNDKSLFTSTFFLLLFQCTSNHNRDDEAVVKLIQTVLADKQLESELKKDFGNQQLTFVAGQNIKTDQQFIFADKSVRITPLTGDVYEIHKQHPDELYVSVPEVKFYSRDSATVSLIFHAGNATTLFSLKNEEGSWLIKRRQNGKF